MDIIGKLSSEFGLRREQAENTIKLIDEGNTIPFIARYRKEVTGGLTDVVLRDLDERLKYLRGLEERKEEGKRGIQRGRGGEERGREEGSRACCPMFFLTRAFLLGSLPGLSHNRCCFFSHHVNKDRQLTLV